MPQILWTVLEGDDRAQKFRLSGFGYRANRVPGSREEIPEDGGVIGEQTPVHAKLHIPRDQDHGSVLEPKLSILVRRFRHNVVSPGRTFFEGHNGEILWCRCPLGDRGRGGTSTAMLRGIERSRFSNSFFYCGIELYRRRAGPLS